MKVVAGLAVDKVSPGELIGALLGAESTCCSSAASAPSSRRPVSISKSATAPMTPRGVNGGEIRAKVIAKANLGATQLAIEYARARDASTPTLPMFRGRRHWT